MAKQTGEREKRSAQKCKRREKRLKKRVKPNMSDATRLYRVVLRHLRRQPTAMLPEHQLTLAILITGILRGRSGQLRKIANAVTYNGKKESLIDRFRGFVRNPHLEVAVEYASFGQRLLKAIGSGPIVLMIDSTKLGGQCLCLMVSPYYKSRALPLAWVAYKGRKGHSSQAVQLKLFKQVKALLPAEVPVVLVGDGEFDGCEVVDWFQQETPWRFVCRTDKTNQVFYLESKQLVWRRLWIMDSARVQRPSYC